MDPETFQMTPAELQDMLDSSPSHPYLQMPGRPATDLTCQDFSKSYIENFFSDPMKRMQTQYLQNTINRCYQGERHQGYSRYEQVMVCKETERQRIWGKFDRIYYKCRDKSRLSFQDCIEQADGDLEKGSLCVRDYVVRINQRLIVQFRREYF